VSGPASDPASDAARVAIVGAGPQGLTVAVYLVAAGVDPADLVVIDPAGDWLVQWRRRFAALGIEHLRSPSVHHPHPDPYGLSKFAAEQRRGDELHHRYGLPSTALFHDFCDRVIAEQRLSGLVRSDTVVSISASGEVRLASGEPLTADHVVWATNPAVASPVGGCVPGGSTERPPSPPNGSTVAVIGGGLTAAHVVARAVDAGAHVEWVTRRPIVEREFDTDPGWLGPLEMQGFARIADRAERLQRVIDARGGGTVPPWMMQRLRPAERSGQICRRVGTVEVDGAGDQVHVLVDGRRVVADVVWDATGDRPCVSAAPPLERLCDELGVVRHGGRPEVDRMLRLPGSVVHVAGRLAQLELGPTAGNLAGARRAAELVVGAVVGADAMYALAGA
jgi:cation diffusion facilitator CzcD-associated flavoprotein CzcO